jgi:hypothetical protein
MTTVMNQSQSDYDDDDLAEEGDITDRASWYRTTGRELTKWSWYPYWESQEWAEGRSEDVGTPSGPAVTSGNNETVMWPICLCGFVRQEVGTPEDCNHSFCADCLQGLLKKTNTCPVD